MTEKRLFAGWLRSLGSLVAVAGILALSACGGGSGAPNNFFKSTMTVTPNAAIAFAGIPIALTITGGTGPFRAFSSNPSVLPVMLDVNGRTIALLPNSVTADSDVTITVQDLGPLQPSPPTVTAVITVRPTSILSTLTITPNLPDCGTSLCSGQTALASVKLLGAQGGPAAGHAVRFDVIGSAYSIVTNNPAQPLASSLTVLSDSTGVASVVLKANVNAPTQVAQLSITDLTSGQVLVGSFTIVQVTDGSTILTVVPGEATITGRFKGECSSGFVTDYYIYGGTPPYRVTSTFPNSVNLVNSIVNVSGGFFEAITNGACVDPLTFSIVDATGRQTTALLHNVEGTDAAPAGPPAVLSVTPQAIPNSAGNCNGLNATILVTGGTAPYNIVQTSASTPGVPPVVLATAGTTTLVFPASPDTAVNYSFTVKDSGNPLQSSSFTYDCN